MISVIIPNYNHELYLKERIESVLNQSYTDFEVIILDDCSTDQSREVIEAYRSHPKVSHIVYNDVNSGSTFKQWQKGITLAQGDWIWIAESDDVALPHFLSSVTSLLKHENVDLVFCNSQIIDEHGDNSSSYGLTNIPSKETYVEFSKNQLFKGVEFTNQWMYKDNFIVNASAVVFRKSKIPVGIFDRISQMKLMGDWLFWVQYLMQYEDLHIGYFSESMNLFRNHTSNVRSTKEKYRILEMPNLITQIQQPDLKSKFISTLIYRYTTRNQNIKLLLSEKIQIHLFLIQQKRYLNFIKSIVK